MNMNKLMTPVDEAMGKLCKALHMPKHVVAFHIKAHIDELPTINVTYHPSEPSNEDIAAFTTLTEDFTLVPKNYFDTFTTEACVENEKLRQQLAELRESGRVIIRSEMERTKDLVILQENLRWRHLKDGLPPIGKYIEVVRMSGMNTTKYEFLTAKYDPDYKGWTDVHNDRLTDSGYDPLAWRPLPEFKEQP